MVGAMLSRDIPAIGERYTVLSWIDRQRKEGIAQVSADAIAHDCTVPIKLIEVITALDSLTRDGLVEARRIRGRETELSFYGITERGKAALLFPKHVDNDG